MRCPLERSRHDPVFLSQSSPTLLLSRDFVIKAVSRSYVASTGRAEDDLVSADVFEAFPANPDAPEAQSTEDFIGSVERVLRSRRPHRTSPLRYDVADPRRPGQFVQKRWMTVNTPVQDGDDVVGVMVRVEDVTLADQGLLRAVRAHRDVAAMLESYTQLAEEVVDLRRALRSRPTIEQAKGIIMADRCCSPDEAFARLRQLSMESNVPLADVAAAVVYQRRSPE